MFHVKHAIASVATGCSHTGMTEHEHVGSEGAQHVGFTNSISEVQQAGSEGNRVEITV